jgi:hypothetical protein
MQWRAVIRHLRIQASAQVFFTDHMSALNAQAFIENEMRTQRACDSSTSHYITPAAI